MHRSLPCRATAALLAGLLIFLPALRTNAARRPRATTVVVAPYAPLHGVSGALAARVTALVTGELSGRDSLRLTEATGSSKKIARAAPDFGPVLSRARAALGEGRDLSLQKKPAQAANVLALAVAALASRPGAIDAEGGKLLAELMESLAVERMASSDEDGADAAVAALVRLAPDRAAPVGSFPAGFLREFKTVQRRTLGQTRGTIRVSAARGSGQAHVSLDGRPLHAAPVLIKDVPPGDHFLRVERGGEIWAERVSVLAGAEVAIAPQLGDRLPGPAGDLLAALQTGELDRAALAKAGKLAKAARAEAVIFGAVARQGDGFTVRSFAYFARSGRLLQLAVMSLDGELLGGSLEVLRVGDDLVRKLVKPGSEVALPLSLGTPADQSAAGVWAEVSAAPPASPDSIDPTSAPPLPDLPDMRTPAALATDATPSSATAASASPAKAAAAAGTTPAASAAVAVAPASPPAPPLVTAPASPLVTAQASPVVTAPSAPASPAPPLIAATPAQLRAVDSAALTTPRDEQPVAAKNHTALWIVLGVASAAALGAGGYFLYQGSRTASTATLNASWTK